MDCDEVDLDVFTAEHYKVSEEHWVRLLEMMAAYGYIEGIFSMGRNGSTSKPPISIPGASIEKLTINAMSLYKIIAQLL